MHDLRFALRSLAQSPGFTAVVVLSLALGIGSTTTVLCWIRHVLLAPLPGVARQEEIVALVSNEGGGNISLLDSRDFNALATAVAGVAVSQVTPASLVLDRTAEWTYGQIASANFFALLGVKPLLGRTFLPDEDQHLGGDAVLVLSENLWRRRFGADPAVIGRVVDLNRHPFTIIGVVPATFRGTMTGLACEFWAPISMVREVASWPASYVTGRSSRGFHNVVRLQPGVTLAQAQAAIEGLNTALAELYPRTNREVRHRLVPYRDAPIGAQSLLGPTLRLLLAVGVGVLLIVTANVANLLLVRGASRQREIAIRLATGASRARLVRLLLTESILLALLGGTAGVLLASWAVDGLIFFLPALQLPLAMSTPLDLATLGLTLLLVLVTAVLFGLVPAWQATNPRLYETLKEGARSTGGSAAHHRLRHGFVVAEVALALVLLVAAALCWKGLRQARQIDVGFEPEGVLIAGLQIGMNGYDETTGKRFYRQLQERIAALPEVEEVALASWFPLGLEGCKGYDVRVDGYERPAHENATYEYARVSPRYFATMRLPLVAGRDFTVADDADTLPVAIVNEHFAQRFWPGQDAVGRTFRSAGRVRTIIGVARAGKYRSLDEPPHPFFYLPYQQGVAELDLSLCVRTRIAPAALAEAVRREVRGLDPGVDLWGAVPLSVHVQGAFLAQRIATSLLGALGVVALILAAMGVYAVMAYSVSQRTHEFGVRLALGAQPALILRQVVRHGLLLAAVGTLIGLAVALGVTRLLAGFLYGVSPFDLTIFLTIPLLLVTTAVVASFVPARRATRVDPLIALRAE